VEAWYGLLGPPTKFTTLSPQNTTSLVYTYHHTPPDVRRVGLSVRPKQKRHVSADREKDENGREWGRSGSRGRSYQ
jgi:hypothetical protein